MLTRYRVQLMGDRTRETTRLELMLEDASIKLSSVASSLNTVSARAMLTAMIDGETDPLVLADLAKGRMRRKIPDLAQALTGHFDAHHAQLARSMLRRLELVEQALAELDAVHRRRVPAVGAPDRAAADHSRGRGEGRAGDRRRDRRGHVPVPDRGAPGGVGRVGAGDERVRRQTVPAGKRHGNKWLTAMLVEAAGSVGRMHGKNYLAAQHARLAESPRAWAGRRSRSRTRCWSRPTTCCNAMSPTTISAPTGTAAATTKPTPVGWSRSWKARPHRDPRPSRLNSDAHSQRRVHARRRSPPALARVFTGLCQTSILRSGWGTQNRFPGRC